jgi:hypothetical protein
MGIKQGQTSPGVDALFATKEHPTKTQSDMSSTFPPFNVQPRTGPGSDPLDASPEVEQMESEQLEDLPADVYPMESDDFDTVTDKKVLDQIKKERKEQAEHAAVMELLKDEEANGSQGDGADQGEGGEGNPEVRDAAAEPAVNEAAEGVPSDVVQALQEITRTIQLLTELSAALLYKEGEVGWIPTLLDCLKQINGIDLGNLHNGGASGTAEAGE